MSHSIVSSSGPLVLWQVVLLEEVAYGKWDRRFNEIEVTALMELNAFVANLSASHPASGSDVSVSDLSLGRLIYAEVYKLARYVRGQCLSDV